MADVNQVQFGLDTFGDRPALGNGELMSHPDSIRQVVKEGVLADQLGVDIFALGEHHRDDYAISAPEPVLATLAGLTDNIKLGSAVTVLSSDDPVRVFQRFATLDALSNGRAQVMLGRGSFTESFPLFGYELSDYDILFEEKLNLFVELLKEKPVTWQGTTRASLHHDDVFPKTESGHLDAVIGVGGSPQSVLRAARYDLPLMLAIIGGDPRRFARYIDLYQRAAEQFGTTAHPVGIHSPGFVADTDDEAIEAFWPYFRDQRNRIGAERGWGPTSTAEFERELESGSLYVGSPETVAKKMASTIGDLGVGRFDLTYSFGAQPADARLRNVELYGSQVVPRVKELLGQTDSGKSK